jgi:hypothetical protein
MDERQRRASRGAREKKFRVAAGGKKLYLLAVPNCLKGAQYPVDDSVMAHRAGTSRRSPRGCRETWLCSDDPDRRLNNECAFSSIGHDRRAPRLL